MLRLAHLPANAQHGVLTLPVVSGGDPSATFAINAWLQTESLGNTAGLDFGGSYLDESHSPSAGFEFE
ncbi:hypothetical protein [Paraburkholderia phenazinium]|nr:hypothetical protein [Paraburkholderia phenazinium]